MSACVPQQNLDLKRSQIFSIFALNHDPSDETFLGQQSSIPLNYLPLPPLPPLSPLHMEAWDVSDSDSEVCLSCAPCMLIVFRFVPLDGYLLVGNGAWVPQGPLVWSESGACCGCQLRLPVSRALWACRCGRGWDCPRTMTPLIPFHSPHSLFLSLSLFHSLFLSLSFSISLSHSTSLSVTPSLFTFSCPCLCICLSLCLSHSHPFCLYLFLPVFLYLSLSLPPFLPVLLILFISSLSLLPTEAVTYDDRQKQAKERREEKAKYMGKQRVLRGRERPLLVGTVTARRRPHS